MTRQWDEARRKAKEITEKLIANLDDTCGSIMTREMIYGTLVKRAWGLVGLMGCGPSGFPPSRMNYLVKNTELTAWSDELKRWMETPGEGGEPNEL